MMTATQEEPRRCARCDQSRHGDTDSAPTAIDDVDQGGGYGVGGRDAAGAWVGGSTAELLATVLGPGVPSARAVRGAERLLRERGGLAGLARQVGAGEGDARTARRAAAALELGRRLLLEPAAMPLQIRSPHDVGPRLVAEMAALEQECLRLILLDTKNHVLAMPTVYIGGVDQIAIHPRDVFREAVRRNATGIIVAHNHPSGDPIPSPEDVATTRELVRAGVLLGIAVLDHLVVGRHRYVSLKERRLGFD
jgi:DNA repair protein RadC